jgi:hypothetical protein
MKRIKLLLKGTASILSDYQYATVTTLEKQIDISLDNEKLAAGSHVWNFTMISPSTTATQERSTYGNVRHTCESQTRAVEAARDQHKETERARPLILRIPLFSKSMV